MPLLFHFEEVPDPGINQQLVSAWIETIVKEHNRNIGDINYVFCSAAYLHNLNKEHLNHDYETDIITFELSDDQGNIDADIFISVGNVKENASSLEVDFSDELNRVMIHGILHLLGFGDKTESEKSAIREMEDRCLARL